MTMSVCTHNLYHGPPHRAPAGRPSFGYGRHATDRSGKCPVPIPSSGGSSKDPYLTPIAPVVAFCEDIRRMRNVLKGASGADSSRIGALGICGNRDTRWTQPNLTPRVKACTTLSTLNAGRARRLGSREVEYISSRDRRKVMHLRRAKQCTQTVGFQENKPRKLICVHCCRRPCATLSVAASSRAKEYHELPSGQTFQAMSYRQQPDRSGCRSFPYIP